MPTARRGEYLQIAIGSASELEYHLITARDIGAISSSEYLSLYAELSEVRMMLHGLVRNLERTGNKVVAHSR